MMVKERLHRAALCCAALQVDGDQMMVDSVGDKRSEVGAQPTVPVISAATHCPDCLAVSCMGVLSPAVQQQAAAAYASRLYVGPPQQICSWRTHMHKPAWHAIPSSM
jgi:hypothetical protein